MDVLLVDDHTIFRHGIKLIIESIDKSISVRQVSSTSECIDILGSEPVDLILLDLQLSDTSGLDSVICVKHYSPLTPVIVLSGDDDPLMIHKTIEHGAMGFISKRSSLDELQCAFDRVIEGGVYLPDCMTVYASGDDGKNDRLKSANNNLNLGVLDSLSDRQREILYYVLQGKPNKTISSGLCISDAAVRNDISGILFSLGARNRTEAVYVAARAGVPIERKLTQSFGKLG